MNEEFGGLNKPLGLDDEFNFGKYRGETIAEVLEKNPGYIVWAQENVSHFNVDPLILEEAEEAAEDRRSKAHRNIRFRFAEPGDDIPF